MRSILPLIVVLLLTGCEGETPVTNEQRCAYAVSTATSYASCDRALNCRLYDGEYREFRQSQIDSLKYCQLWKLEEGTKDKEVHPPTKEELQANGD